MEQDEPVDVTELGDREVGRQGGLLSFLADDADANGSCLDHRHIVSSVSNHGNWGHKQISRSK